MCVICVSGYGVPQPGKRAITNMWTNNYHGAGYMVARGGRVVLHKGYDSLADFLADVEEEHFTENDVVIYHFRIATQARRHQMTQPFPLTDDETGLQSWDAEAAFGVAHNGIIRQTSNGNPMLSDTALYIRDFLAPRISTEEDVKNELETIEKETSGSKIAILSGSGRFWLTGQWIYDGGLLYSNDSYQEKYYRGFTFSTVKNITDQGKGG